MTPIIEEYEIICEDEHVSLPTKEHETPSFAFINTVKHVKTPRQTVKEQNTCSQSPKPDKKDCSGLMAEKPRTGKIQVNTTRTSGTNTVNTARTSGTNTVNTARHNFNRHAVPTNAARKVNTVKPIMNNAKTKLVNAVSVGEKGKLLLSPQQVVIGDTKDITGTKSPNTMVGIKHMTGNKAYLAKYQDYNGGPVAFGGSKGYITGKGKIKTGKLDFKDVCFVKLPDENQILLRVPRQNNMYSFNLENIVPSGGLACLIAKATVDESNKWHRRLGHVNFKNLNKLVKGNLVRGLPSKTYQNDHTCVACQKGKQHKASCKAKVVSSISQPLQLLHMDIFGPTSIRSINHKTYCLVITDDFSRVLVTKPQNKTPYELITGKIPIINYIRHFGCHVTILNTIDHLGKFEGKSDEGFLVGYSLNSKAFKVYNLETKRIKENLHMNFLENKPNIAGKGLNWLFDLDYLTDSMNYQPMRSDVTPPARAWTEYVFQGVTSS
ncbi:ribonuclease H-like domain-containing protein [Tanacetum coccineum]